MTKHQVRQLVIILALLLASGCTQLVTSGNSAPPANQRNQERIAIGEESGTGFLHRVQRRGETLILIAKWYTGSGNNWRTIARANPELEPRRIQLGDGIRIPDELLRTRQVMPADFSLAGQRRKPELAETEAPPQRQEADSLDLFGPVDSAEYSTKQDGEEDEEMKMILESLDE